VGRDLEISSLYEDPAETEIHLLFSPLKFIDVL